MVLISGKNICSVPCSRWVFLFFTLVGILIVQNIQAEDANFCWAKAIGGEGYEWSNSMVIDSNNNFYIVGRFTGTVDFDPGFNIVNFTSNDQPCPYYYPEDFFILKFDSKGGLIWARSIGGAGFDYAPDLVIDGDGNVYITGGFQDTVDFDPGPGVFNLTSTNSNVCASNSYNLDIYVSKLDRDGNFLWAKAVGGEFSDYASEIVLDSSGNIYLSGSFAGTVDFDPGTGVFNLTGNGTAESSIHSPFVSDDIFVTKLDNDGNFLWAKSMGGDWGDYVNDLAIDKSGNLYITGSFYLTVDFDPGTGLFNLTSNGNSDDVFVSKLANNGDFVWAKSFGGSGSDRGQVVEVDASGNLLILGNYTNSVDFDPGPDVTTLVSNDDVEPGEWAQDIFVSKLDGSGNFLWARGFGGTLHDQAASLTLDSSGNIYTAGSFNDLVDFDPGPANFNLESNAGDPPLDEGDAFISKLDSGGNFLWAKAMGGKSGDHAAKIALDSSGNIYTTGYFSDTVDFDTGPTTYTLQSAGLRDVFISKLGDCEKTFPWFLFVPALKKE